MREFQERLKKIKRIYRLGGATLLLQGETGTGKSFLAEEMHNDVFGSKRPFVQINAAAIPKELFEAELFGHTKGAFTGAFRESRGKVGTAENGTLFIDEVGEISLASQAKLLTFLDTGEYYSVGCEAKKRFYGCLIFATNRNLKLMVKEGLFRADLYYRLRVFDLVLPRIADDKDSLIELVNFFLEKYNNQYFGFNRKSISNGLRDWIVEYHWPGNIRELKNMIHFLVAMSEGSIIHLGDLPDWIGYHSQIEKKSDEPFQATSYKQALNYFEANFLESELEKRKGRINRTAMELGISKTTLIAKVRKYGIKSKAA